ncbi:D-hexose-6-phosphate mutarotase [Georgenia alba]|uniref:Putative glucose-6-phosphate 1-epimerase n=1 Tax=Georgenia alba TaxID=2233858 RepID=A0ABW2QBL2_9MICO
MPATTPLPDVPGLPAGVTLENGEGGLPVLRVETARATGEVYLHGGQVTGWTPAGHAPVIWTSPRARFEPDAAIRGGIPLCFPWFGPGREPEMRPAHGFARLADFTLLEAREDDGDVALTLRLTDEDAAGLPGTDVWPFPFELTCQVRFGSTLRVAVTTRNTSAHVRSYEEAQHAYLAVQDVRDVRITGLDGAPYLDKVGTPGPHTQRGELTFAGETDRIYGSTSDVTVHDPGLGRRLTVTKQGSASTIVWSPWSAKAAAMADLGEEHWTGMVCVEPANVLHDGIVLEPGASHTTTVTYAVERS